MVFMAFQRSFFFARSPAISVRLSAKSTFFRSFSGKIPVYWRGFLGGVFSIALSAGLVGAALYTCGKNFITVSKIIIVAHLPVMIIEGIITGTIVVFLAKLRPEMLPREKNKEGNSV